MTEKEKVAAGQLYNPNHDPELLKEMAAAHTLCQQYNAIPFDHEAERDKALRQIVTDMGKNATIMSPFFCDYGRNIHIGDNFFANTNFTVLDGASVEIGRNVFIAPNVGLYTAGHPLDPVQRAEGIEYARPIRIGDDVWIGAGVSVLPGVTIGSRTVIGAGSVVTHDIPSDVVAAGNPCKVIKRIKE